MSEKLTESVPRRDSENLFVNFTKEHSAIHTGKQNGASWHARSKFIFDHKFTFESVKDTKLWP